MRTRTHTQPKPKPTAGPAQVNVLRSLLPVLGQLENLVVETSVGWWLRRYNVSRHEGAELYASLLEQVRVRVRIRARARVRARARARVRVRVRVRVS